MSVEHAHPKPAPSSDDMDASTKKLQLALEEARVVIPGLQALFGFQMIAIFNQRFAQLPVSEQLLHLWAVYLTTLSIALLMAPAIFHRIAEPDAGSHFFLRFASWMIALAMAPLAVSLTFDVYIVGAVILGAEAKSAAIAAALFVLLAGLWFVFPLVKRKRRQSR